MRVSAQTLAATRALQAPSPRSLNQPRAGSTPSSAVTLSGAAEALISAQHEATSPRIRPDVVAQIRADLAAGRVGTPADIEATVDGLMREFA